MPLGPWRPAIDAPGAEMRSKWRLPASSRSSRFGRGRRKPDWGSMSEGILSGIVRDAPAGVKTVGKCDGAVGSNHRMVDATERTLAGCAGGKSSEGDTPSVLESGPRLERVPPVDSVVQQ